MNILIIDGFNENAEGRRRLQDFYNAVIKGLDKCWTHGKRVQVKRYDDLGDFVPANKDGIIRVEPLKNFDKLDMIFIEGDLPLRPWSGRARQVSRVISMGVQTGKCIWASSFAAGLVMCALNTKGSLDRMPKLLSDLPEGGTMQDLRTLPPPQTASQNTAAVKGEGKGKEEEEAEAEEPGGASAKQHADELDALFLDAESGDCYEADFSTGKFRGYKFAFNCGLRRRKVPNPQSPKLKPHPQPPTPHTLTPNP